MKTIRVASPDSVNEVQADTGFCCQSKNLVESVSHLSHMSKKRSLALRL